MAAALTDDPAWRLELALNVAGLVLDGGDAVVDGRLSVPVACELRAESRAVVTVAAANSDADAVRVELPNDFNTAAVELASLSAGGGGPV